MNSALKPVLASAGVPQPTGQSSPAKGNVASVNHASVGHPQGAQNSLNHANTSNNLAVQNLTQHVPAPQALPHAVPSMAPVSANMAQMAQNMSNHGNLSHVNQNSGPPAPAAAASPSKAPSTSSPLSLVAEKANASQPLALTRSPEKPEKKEPDSTGQANGTVDSPKSASNAPVTLKPQNTEANKDKQDIAKTSPSTTKPPEKPLTLPSSQKTESTNPAVPGDVPTQPKAAVASEPTAASPSKPAETKPTPMADVAPAQSDSKPVPESASKSEPSPLEKEKTPAPAKQDPPAESPKPEPVKVEEKKEVAPEKPSTEEKPKETEVKEKPEPPKKEDTVDAPVKVAEKEKVEPKKEVKPKSTLKLATVTTPLRKRRQVSPVKGSDGPSPAKKAADGESTPADARTKRNRTKVQLYQSPTPELAMATKLSASAGRSTPTKPNDDKLIVFYKNEYLAVRNAEGGFYVCQAMQNVYRTTRKIKIRWLSQDKQADPSGETYKPDFYDVTDMECVLTTLSLTRAAGSGGSQVLRAAEQARATSILQRALRADTSPGSLQLTPEHPDGLDLSLYTDESQLEKRARKRAATKTSPRNKGDNTETAKEEVTPVKKARTPKRSPKSTRKAKVTPPQPAPPKTNNNKRKSPGSTPVVASTSKTATAVVEKAKAAAKPTPKRTPAKPKPEPVVTPLRKGRRTAAKEAKAAAAQPSPGGKAGRTPRKPPARK